MSKLISGKEALIAKLQGKDVQFESSSSPDLWNFIGRCDLLGINEWINEKSYSNPVTFRFRIKPKTTLLNGVEVGHLVSSQWSRDEPNKVKLEFNSQEDAIYFRNKALDIFNHNNG